MGDSRTERDDQVRRDTDVIIRRVGWFVVKLLFFLFVFVPTVIGFLLGIWPYAASGARNLFGGGA